MKQLHDRVMFEPISSNDLTKKEKKRATESLILLLHKRSSKIKVRMVANGITQRAYTECDDTSSPTEAINAIIITGVIEAKQGRDLMINDIPNDFVQTPVFQDEGDTIIIMKIQGALVYILCNISREIHKPYVSFDEKSGEKILHVRMLKAL